MRGDLDTLGMMAAIWLAGMVPFLIFVLPYVLP